MSETIYWAPAGKAPAKLVAGVNWWLNSDPAHAEDVIALTNDRQDALILTGFSDFNASMGMVWVDYEGTVRTLTGTFQLIHMEDEDEEEE